MNLFYLDDDMAANARSHVDRHIVKMPLEAAQLACTALSLAGASAPYKPTHKNHPCAVWCRNTRSNFEWVCAYGLALCAEYTYRYDKLHKCREVLLNCLDAKEVIPVGGLSPFALAMPDIYKCDNALLSYRRYYVGAKQHLAAWKHRPTPAWFTLSTSKT